MRRQLLGAMTALATGLTVVAVLGASPSTSVERAASSLKISPDVFVGGQSLHFVGSISGAPNSQLKIETLFSRGGDAWNTRDGIVGTTNSAGAFDFYFPGPNNFGIRYRVKASNGKTSPPVVLEPRQQEVELSLNDGEPQEPGTVVSGDDFTIYVDTTPTGRGNLGRPAPPFPGRELALQQRVRGDQWTTVQTAPASNTGTAQFTLTAGTPGPLAYRIRQDDITTGGNKIGWFPSFPLELTVVSSRAAARASTTSPAIGPVASPVVTRSTSARSTGGTPLASQRYRWGPPAFDFAWEEGESLTSPPYRGTKRKGKWIDRSDGSGRVAHYNGGMGLGSNVSEFPGDGDHGSTSATLKGNALKYGRWEFRRRIDVFENVGPDYRIKIELVPAKAKQDHCGANTITVADVSYNSGSAKLGVNSYRAKKSWSGSKKIPKLGDGPHSFGIEVTRDHITWFLDGNSLATVKNRKVSPGVPLTPRLSLVGQQQNEMRRTRVLYDWQRGWPLNKQAQKAKRGSGLKARKLKGAC